MDRVDYAETPGGQTGHLRNFVHPQADSSQALRGRIKPCSLCCTLNHPLSCECYNCGWRGAFSKGDPVASHDALQPRLKTSLLPAWWLRVWSRLRSGGSQDKVKE